MNKILSLIALSIAISSCGSSTVTLQGAGATFPAPIYNQIFAQYTREYNVPVTYQAVGSGAGIRNITSGIVDFGATDAFMSNEELAELEYEIFHIPAVLAAVNFTYHLPNSTDNDPPLKLSTEVIYKMYAGEITKWNDNAIQALNPNHTLPDIDVIPVYRSDSSGTTYIMSEYMTKVNSNWENTFGAGKTINWIVGVGQKGNSSVMGFVKENSGAIAYVDLVYAKQNNMPVAAIENPAGKFVVGDIANASAAAASIVVPKDTRVSLTAAKGDIAAPMSTFSYLLVRKEQNYNNRTLAQAQELVKLLQWMYSDQAQLQHPELYFSPLPKNVLTLGQNIINSITYDNQPVVDTLQQ